ncbi:uncharacterized protein LOC127803042 [Diospyros lotus]|uniref:uncharacterized protein LOC127803042 n=1 Tax=Diospyros lotus TaxID=55363 RepID=UPI002252C09D|nr:uncharacterized protein LOC127803042 [Diospyros lotus]XP_052195006.1 uncharacterized protein LOC127803042 [Diospyros lotus]XP_052195008.1 uncharacterized protein LOC127803042 [Diospyros lotus]
MAFLSARTSLVGLYHHRHSILSIISNSNVFAPAAHDLFRCLCPSRSRNRWLSTATESAPSDLAGQNAYDLLGVSETSSLYEIKESFRKLAKETHPDLARSTNDSSAARRFIQILAAYEILSDYEKRAHYDRYLLSQRILVQRHCGQGSAMYRYDLHRTEVKQMEVVEWLKWYRFVLNDILLQKKVVFGSGYFDVLERDFYSAIHAAYYGPEIESMDLLPECFEAEERSAYDIPEVLHLVSGRDLFGMVCLAEKFPELTQSCREKLTSFASRCSGFCQSLDNVKLQTNSDLGDIGIVQMQGKSSDFHASDAYQDLELCVLGKVVAVATRVPPKSYCNGIRNEDTQDHIHVFLCLHEDPRCMRTGISRDSFMGAAVGSMNPLGTITGLGTNSEEGSCSVYNSNGTKTHVIMKHRTLLVKHMHWYQVGDKVSVCECRCSRASLPPSKFWLFEPRCGTHDIGGWYIETFARDRKGRNVPSRRYWDGFDADEQFEKRLHPAMYLLALAYRTLDLEDAKRRNRTVLGIVQGKFSGIISWCKKLI